MATLNLAAVLSHSARLMPDRVAIACGGDQLTYRELDARANGVAAALTARGIQPGDRVVLSCPNIPWFPIAYFGILKAGAAVVPLHVLLKPPEIAYHLRDSAPRAYLAFQGTPELPIAAMARAACVEAGIDPPIVMPFDVIPAAFDNVPRDPDDTAVILYTSGTTGQPKGAELTHANMVSNAMTCHHLFSAAFDGGLTQHAALVTLPLFHATAQTTQMNAGLFGGYRLVLLPRFDPAVVLNTIARERIEFWVAVPTMYWELLQHARGIGADMTGLALSLRLCVSGGAPMPVEVMRDFEAAFGARILEGYGLSETAPVATFNQLHLPSKPGTVGMPIFGVEVRCVDERDIAVAAGERGEVVIRGPNVMKGYLGRPQDTADALRGGWFHTGDIGVLDGEGYLSIVDRKKDLIVRGGTNVYPREIEEVLMTHPAVALSAVIGVPDARLGEEVKAFVVLRPGAAIPADELIEWCRDRMAAFKYPRSVEIRDSLPVGATGKLLKRALREAHP